jgi:hypothetical protein
MLIGVIVGAVISLLILVGLVALVLRRAPQTLVADKLPGNMYSGADEVEDLFAETEERTSSRDIDTDEFE